ncbi:hypothetical protein F511_42007 [Dorcoceras hygrometricum]|uniref:Uncharacterized protein n=1 Tax=Dorcoceras hygrometricum TaxID=472368 RepID=A0A2Z7BZH2_9LAMI|nr:hypothetical protein F511_42007 [Dorcoceras hygrometricum]
MSYVSPSSFFRKVPLEDLIYTSCTDPIPQPAAARTPRLHQPSTVTHLFYAYVRKATDTEFKLFVLGRDLILFVIHSLINFAHLSKYASESVCVRFYSVSLNSQIINLTHWENASTKSDEDSAVDTAISSSLNDGRLLHLPVFLPSVFALYFN